MKTQNANGSKWTGNKIGGLLETDKIIRRFALTCYFDTSDKSGLVEYFTVTHSSPSSFAFQIVSFFFFLSYVFFTRKTSDIYNNSANKIFYVPKKKYFKCVTINSKKHYSFMHFPCEKLMFCFFAFFFFILVQIIIILVFFLKSDKTNKYLIHIFIAHGPIWFFFFYC